MTTVPPNLAALPAPNASPLSPAHLAELQSARLRHKKLRRAARVATLDAWLTALFAATALLSGLFSLSALLLGLAMAAVAYHSFRGAAGLRALDLAAPRRLALNQLALMAAITLYALYCLWSAARGPGLFTAYLQSEPQLAGLLDTGTIATYDRLARLINLALYLGLIAGTVLAQGLAALYYATRARHLQAYRHSTPQWILDLQAASQF